MAMEATRESATPPVSLKLGRTEIVKAECADGRTTVLEIECGRLHDSPDGAKAEHVPDIGLRDGTLTLDGAPAEPGLVKGAETCRERIVAITGRASRLDFYLLKEA